MLRKCLHSLCPSTRAGRRGMPPLCAPSSTSSRFRKASSSPNSSSGSSGAPATRALASRLLLRYPQLTLSCQLRRTPRQATESLTNFAALLLANTERSLHTRRRRGVRAKGSKPACALLVGHIRQRLQHQRVQVLHFAAVHTGRALDHQRRCAGTSRPHSRPLYALSLRASGK